MKDTTLKIINWDPKELKRLRNLKESEIILGNCEGWKDFLLKLAGIRK